MSGGFVLIASYPKSGNTWMRVVLERLRRGTDQPVSINDLDVRYQGIFRRLAFDSWIPVNAADLTFDEIEGFLPDFWRCMASEVQDFAPVKVHDAATRNFRGEWLYPPDCVRTVIYLVRHPFDVAVSLAYHLNATPEEAVAMMADDGSKRRPYWKLVQPLPQNFGSWSSNVESWIDNTSYRINCCRYEDLHADPTANIRRLADAAGLSVPQDELEAVVTGTNFERLQREEKESGFREKSQPALQFFRSGRPGAWRDVLGQPLRDRLVRDHGRVMERLGYGADGEVKKVAASQ